MRITEAVEHLFEAPLPDDWDADIYNEWVPFAQRLRYAKERAMQLGRGSSRVAFEIPYQGRKTALKIAINHKGIAQNEEESMLLDDYMVRQIGIVIPLIDYDERNPQPTWIHTEYAQKITQKQLERFFGGVSLTEIVWYLDYHRSGKGTRINLPDEIFENEYFQRLQDLVLNFGIPAGDLARKANWGLYKGEPVIIDLGLTENTLHLYS